MGAQVSKQGCVAFIVSVLFSQCLHQQSDYFVRLQMRKIIVTMRFDSIYLIEELYLKNGSQVLLIWIVFVSGETSFNEILEQVLDFTLSVDKSVRLYCE